MRGGLVALSQSASVCAVEANEGSLGSLGCSVTL